MKFVLLVLAIIGLIMINENNKIEELEKRIEELEEQKGQLEYPLNKDTELLLRHNLSDEIFNAIWNDHFYLYSHFEGDDGWGLSDWGGGSGVGPLGIFLMSGEELPSSANLNNPPVNLEEVFNNELRFRSSISITQASGYEFVFSIGAGGGDDTAKHLGFYAKDNVLYGTSNDEESGSSNKIKLMDIEAGKRYNIEARFYPNNKIEFYVSDAHPLLFMGSAREFLVPKLRGIITDRLPSGGLLVENTWILLEITPTNGEKVSVSVDFLEYIQKKTKIPISF